MVTSAYLYSEREFQPTPSNHDLESNQRPGLKPSYYSTHSPYMNVTVDNDQRVQLSMKTKHKYLALSEHSFSRSEANGRMHQARADEPSLHIQDHNESVYVDWRIFSHTVLSTPAIFGYRIKVRKQFLLGITWKGRKSPCGIFYSHQIS